MQASGISCRDGKQHSVRMNQRQILQKQLVSCQKQSNRGKVLFACMEEADEVFRDYNTETGGTQLLTLCTTSKMDLETPALGFSHTSPHFVLFVCHAPKLFMKLCCSYFFVIACELNCFNIIHNVHFLLWLLPCNKMKLCPVYEPTWMRAAALGSEELIRTGCEISMLCLLLSWVVLWLTDRAENECRFLAFFFPSPLRWPEPFPLGGEATGDDPRLQDPRSAGSELVPGALAGIGLSISINCFAVSFNWEERRDMVQVSDRTVSCTLHNMCVCLRDLFWLVLIGSSSNQHMNDNHGQQLAFELVSETIYASNINMHPSSVHTLSCAGSRG